MIVAVSVILLTVTEKIIMALAFLYLDTYLHICSILGSSHTLYSIFAGEPIDLTKIHPPYPPTPPFAPTTYIRTYIPSYHQELELNYCWLAWFRNAYEN